MTGSARPHEPSLDPIAEPVRGESLASGALAAILASIGELRARHTPFALCIVAHTEGSTYRKAGAIALVTNVGREGVISGGCLEAELERHARETLVKGTARCVVFDTLTDTDLVFGSGSGCRGRMHVLIVPDRSPFEVLTDALLAADAQHAPLELALCLDPPHVGHGVGWFDTSDVAIAGPCEFSAAARAAAHGVHQLAFGAAAVRVARLRVGNVPRILVVGAGPEAAPLLDMARTLGWRTLLLDHRPVAVRSLAGRADQVIVAHPAAGLARCSHLPIDACVIMTHVATHDLAALRAIQVRPVGYVGLLGPPARRDELLAQLDDAARDALALRLRAPVGLRLGGHGPQAVALAIAAELQRYFARHL